MTTGAVLRAGVGLALGYALVGVAGSLLLMLLGSSFDDDPAAMLLPTVVLAVALAFAGLVVVLMARLAVGWLDGRTSEPVVVAVMMAAGLVMLSGVLTVPSLGLLGVAVAGVLALVTHGVLTRCWT